MKKIEAFVKPFTLEAIRDALHKADVKTFRFVKVQELSSSHKHAEVYRGIEYELDTAPRVLVVAVVEDDAAPDIVERLRAAAVTDHPGDGSILVSHVERFVPIDPNPSESSQ